MSSIHRQKLQTKTKTFSVESSSGDFLSIQPSVVETHVAESNIRISPVTVIVEKECGDDAYFYDLNRKLSGRHEFVESWTDYGDIIESK
jgi:hypothetical protein